MKSTEERALDAVKKWNDGHSQFVVISVVPRFLDGTLYMIGFRDSANAGFENYAYVPDDEEAEIHIYRNSVQLANAVSVLQTRKSFAESVLSVGGITGTLAVLIVLTICYLTVVTKGELKLPEILSTALATILGFYFGTKTTKK